MDEQGISHRIRPGVMAAFPWVVALTIAALAALAWLNRFIQDDAFISFRYADNMVQGKGLVWNEGERVEGYTNFLWVVAVAGVRSLGVEPIAASFALGLGCFVLTLIFCYRLGLLLLGSRAGALLTIVLLGTNFSFSAYATGGLETQLQACLLTAASWLALWSIETGQWPKRRVFFLSLAMAGAFLTRMDSAVVIGVLGLAGLVAIVRRGGFRKAALARLALLLLPQFAIVGAWLAWKWCYYGDILPNTYYAKLGTHVSREAGFYYIRAFLVSYFLVPFPILGLCLAWRPVGSARNVLGVLAGLVALWAAYVVVVGSCFMEFRFLVPILPLAFLLIGWVIVRGVQGRAVQTALVLLVLIGSWHHAIGFGRCVRTQHISTTRELQNALYMPQYNWVGIGKTLGACVGSARDLKLAVTCAGAIPYYSRLTTLDMLGLCNRWVARHGLVIEEMRIGHRRIAPVSYMVKQGVHLLIGHPTVRPRQNTPPHYELDYFCRRWWFQLDGTPQLLLAGASVLEIPVDDYWAVVAIYMKRHPAIEEAIEHMGWVQRPLVLPQRSS